jgi:integrase
MPDAPKRPRVLAERLTQKTVDGLVARAAKNGARRDVRDATLPGLELRLHSGGASWGVRYVVEEGGARRFRRPRLGDARSMSLDDARKRARAILGDVAKGHDPQRERAVARAKAKAGLSTFEALAEGRIAAATLSPATRRGWRSLLKMNVYSRLGGARPESIRRGDILALLEDVRGRVPGCAADVVKVVGWVFARAVEAELLAASPCVGIRKPQGPPRERTLSNEELRALWSSCDAFATSDPGGRNTEGPYSLAVKLLMLVPVRRDEAFSARWSELDFARGTWELPPARTKTRSRHVLPLTRPMRDLFERARAFGSATWIFPGRFEDRPVRATSKAWAALLDGAGLRAAEDNGEADAEPRKLRRSWRGLALHDVRRTIRDRLTRDLGVAPHVAEELLGHRPPRLLATYAPSGSSLATLGRALDKWQNELARIVTGDAKGRVLEFRA